MLLSLQVLQVWPGGYIIVSNTGVPFKWDTTKSVPRDIDGGGFGTIPDPVAFAEAATNVWAAGATLALSFTTSSVGQLAPDGNVDTVAEFAAITAVSGFPRPPADGLSPIVFDEDGSLFDSLGLGPGIVGFAFIDFVGFNSTAFRIVESFQAYNGRFVDGINTLDNPEMPLAGMAAAITHEQGHASNFDHTQVNGHFFIGDTDDPGFALYGAPPAGVGIANIMFPFSLGGGNDANTPNRDDLTTAEFLYGNGTGASGVISGSILRSDGTTPLQGANVIARNTANPFRDAVSSVSGYAYSPAGLGPGPTPSGLEGAYDLRGLTPGANYTIEKVQVNSRFTGGSRVGPIDPPVEITDEEFYNGPAEAASNPPDDPLAFTTVSASAGGIDIICAATTSTPTTTTASTTTTSTTTTSTTTTSSTTTSTSPSAGSAIRTLPVCYLPGSPLAASIAVAPKADNAGLCG